MILYYYWLTFLTDDSPLQHQAALNHSVEKVFPSAHEPTGTPDAKTPAHGTCIICIPCPLGYVAYKKEQLHVLGYLIFMYLERGGVLGGGLHFVSDDLFQECGGI